MSVNALKYGRLSYKRICYLSERHIAASNRQYDISMALGGNLRYLKSRPGDNHAAKPCVRILCTTGNQRAILLPFMRRQIYIQPHKGPTRCTRHISLEPNFRLLIGRRCYSRAKFPLMLPTNIRQS